MRERKACRKSTSRKVLETKFQETTFTVIGDQRERIVAVHSSIVLASTALQICPDCMQEMKLLEVSSTMNLIQQCKHRQRALP